MRRTLSGLHSTARQQAPAITDQLHLPDPRTADLNRRSAHSPAQRLRQPIPELRLGVTGGALPLGKHPALRVTHPRLRHAFGAPRAVLMAHALHEVRGALQAIPRGQLEAGKAIGLTFYQSLGYVLLPQALRQILPTWVNSSTEIVKASTLLSVIGVAELLLSTQQVIARTFMTLEFYLFAGFLFFVINYAIELFGRYIEKRVALP